MRRKHLFRRFVAVVLSGIMISSAAPIDGMAVGRMFTLASQSMKTPTIEAGGVAAEFVNGYIDLGLEVPSVKEDNGLVMTPVLEESYSSVDNGYVTSVKNQGSFGTCWAYAATAAMESYALSHGLVTKTDENPDGVNFSEFALAYTVFSDDLYFDSTGDKTTTTDMVNNLTYGGNNEYAFKALTKWAGIVNDTTDKNTYTNDEQYEVDFNDISYILTGQYYINMADVDRVKAEIVENGAVASNYYSDDMYANDDEGFNHYYIYNYGTVGTNHAITIVGWDDTISKEKFAHTIGDEIYKPTVDGAWLVKNSWGTSYGDEGYMWISYDDVSLKDSVAVVYEIAPKETYDKNYQHDGATIFNVYLDDYKKYANVFTVDGETDEVLKAVSFAISSVNAGYSIQVYKNPEEDKPESGEAMLDTPVTGNTSYMGYYTVTLNETIEFEPGDSFAVVVEFDENVNMIISMPTTELGGGEVKAEASSAVEDNQSYCIDNSTGYEWIYDLYSYGWNVCIKAFASEVESQGDLEIPEIISIEQTGIDKAKITWQGVSGATNYYLYRSELRDSGYAIIAGENDELTGTEYTDTVEYGKTYYYKVKASNEYVESAFSQAEKYMTGVPEVTITSTLEEGVVTITWSEITGVDGYKVYRSEDGSSYTLAEDITAESGKTEYTEEVEKYNKEYYYKVVVYVNADEEVKTSIDSNVINIVKTVPIVSMTQLNNLFYNEALLKWDAVDDIDGYLIYRRDADTLFSVIAELEAEAVSYVDNISEYEPGDQISYFVSAYVLQDGEKVGNNPEGNGYAITVKDEPLKFKWYVDSVGRLTINWNSYSDGYRYIGYISEVQSEEFLNVFTTEQNTYTKNFYLDTYSPENTYYVRLAALSPFNVVSTAYPKEAVKIGGAWVAPVLSEIDDTYVDKDETVVLEAVIENPLENFDYKYQWYVAADGESEGTAIEGANESTYTPDTSAEGCKYYYCEVSGTYIEEYKYRTSNVLGTHTKVFVGEVKDFSVEFDITEITYTGEEIKPTVVVKDGETVLVEGTDYKVVYSEDLINVGTVTILVQGIGQYEYSKKLTFKITAKDISESATLNIEKVDDTVYTGADITIDEETLEIKDGEKVLEKGNDYEITYENNKSVGKAAVVITFKGNYTGEKKLEFNIVEKDVNEDDSVTIDDIDDKEYTGQAITLDETELVVKYGELELQAGVDYDVEYSANVNVGEVTVTLTFRGNYKGTKEVKFNISPKDMSYNEDVVTNPVESQTYTGEEIIIDEENIVLKYGDYTFVKGTDYDISYADNINAGTATIIITFKDNYCGIRNIQFGIVAKDITEELVIEEVANQEYTGNEIKPTLVVKYGEKTLTEGVDYRVEYTNNTNEGTATAKVICMGNYSGSGEVQFAIVVTIPSKVTSSSWSVNEGKLILSKITAGTTISRLLASINERSYIEIRKAGSKVTDSSALVGTGMTVCIMNKTLVKKQYTIVVTGDTNGDGKINITDMISVKSHILGKSTLKGVYGNAGDVNGDGKVNITDFIRVKAHLLGISSVSGVTVQ